VARGATWLPSAAAVAASVAASGELVARDVFPVSINCVAAAAILFTFDNAPGRFEAWVFASTWLAAFSAVPAGALDRVLDAAGFAVPDVRRSANGLKVPSNDVALWAMFETLIACPAGGLTAAVRSATSAPIPLRSAWEKSEVSAVARREPPPTTGELDEAPGDLPRTVPSAPRTLLRPLSIEQ
jgi:hypothetical protein